jgi:hypothetical protein
MFDNKDKSSQQWQLRVIQKIEAASDLLGKTYRKKKVLILEGVFLSILVLWGMFLVPTTILQESTFARNLVQFTVSILPWIDMAKINYGVIADKFVYWQCVSVWVLIIPSLISSLYYSKLRLNRKTKENEFYKALIAIPAGIFLFIFAVVLPNWFHSNTYIPRAQNLFMLNNYLCSMGAVSLAYLFDFILVAMIITTLYLIHFFRNFNQLIKK